MTVLYMLGGVLFEVLPTNLHGFDGTAGHHWAEKPLVGAAPNFEAMGEEPDIVHLAGRILPEKFGRGGLDILRAMARAPIPNLLMRGDGEVLGWYVIHNFRERHTLLGRQGMGRVIEFEIDLRSTPSGPGADALLSVLQGLF